MCGRYLLNMPSDAIRERYWIERDLAVQDHLFQRFNIAPSQPVAAVRLGPGDGRRELVSVRWGLIPSLAKEPKTDYNTINARAETVAVKPTFRDAFRRRRCLIPASGFYEWARRPDGQTKQPFYITLTDGEPFAFAGLWERWEPRASAEGEPVESCTIIVTDANGCLRPIHDRMPVILHPADYYRWLNPAGKNPEELLKPYPEERMTRRPVSARVNSPKYDDPECIAPVAATE